ncbi:MAG: ABC transporter substrate-binding protein [Actinomycetota bacterium]|nr:ABC transporter substrate-binding protein [Actinomycetota bacterium]
MRSRVPVLFCLPALLLAACGGDDEGTPALAGGLPPGQGGTLVWAVADRVETIDPLAAVTRSEQLVSRQVHEPLIQALSGPFGDTREVTGLVRRARPSADQTVWTLTLRAGVRFQDGARFNSQAVLANAERWAASPAGQALLPGLLTFDAPRVDQVRFTLAAPDPAFDERLGAAALGIVSPKALRGRPAAAAIARGASESGTGPFELRERSSGRLLLARNASWWGTVGQAEFGPALDQVEFRVEAESSVRLALLDAGDVQLADELDVAQARQASMDPLLTALPAGDGTALGLERSVRGVDSARTIPALSGVWLTKVRVPD